MTYLTTYVIDLTYFNHIFLLIHKDR